MDRALPTKRVNYSAGHQICLKYLRRGYLETFRELFVLMSMSRNTRRIAEEAEQRFLPELLEDKLSSLRAIGCSLCLAEKERIAGEKSKEYELRLHLGKTFGIRKSDRWLAEYFYWSSYQCVSKMNVKDGRKMIVALERMGNMKETGGEIQEALKLLGDAFDLAEEYNLELTDVVRQSLYLVTHRICLTLGDENWQKENLANIDGDFDPRISEAFKLYKKAYEMAVFADTPASQATAHAKIGDVMLTFKKYESALSHFNFFLQVSLDTNDKEGVCNAYLALSAVYEHLNQNNKATSLLNQCFSIATQCNLPAVLVPCCIAMGKLESDNRNFSEALKHFDVAYSTLRANRELFDNCVSLEKFVRILCGVGRAQSKMQEFVGIMKDGSMPAIQKLIQFKMRNIEFEKPQEK